jgi:hypothetical protein
MATHSYRFPLMQAPSTSCPGAVTRNRIDHRAARVANEVSDTHTLLDNQAAVAIRASGEFVMDDQVAALVLGH